MKSLILWLATVGFIVGIYGLSGCSADHWSPTDPRLPSTDTSHFTIDDSYVIGIGTTVTAN